MDSFTSWQGRNRGRTVTDFEMTVYEYVSQIPRGRVATYKQVAVAISHPNSSRAVGTALSKNPYADPDGDFYVPCHRVINSNFKVGGFLGVTSTIQGCVVEARAKDGQVLSLKEQMLQDEGVTIINGTIAGPVSYRRAVTSF